MKLEARIDPLKQPGEAHIRIFQDRDHDYGVNAHYVGAFYGNSADISDEIAFRINHFEAPSPLSQEGGAHG